MENKLIYNNIEESYKKALILAINILEHQPHKYFGFTTPAMEAFIKSEQLHFMQLRSRINQLPCTIITESDLQYYHITYLINKMLPNTECLLIWNKKYIDKEIQHLTPKSILLKELDSNILVSNDVNHTRIEELKANFNYDPIIIGEIPTLQIHVILDGNHRVYAAKELGIQSLNCYIFNEKSTINCMQSNTFKLLIEIHKEFWQIIQKCIEKSLFNLF